MNNYNKFLEYRKQYPDIIYHSYDITYNKDIIDITFNFEIPGLINFTPKLQIPKKDFHIEIDDSFFRNLVFHIGMVELISYFKCTCSPNVIIKAGYLNQEQIQWFENLYYHGLGEFLYVNQIQVEENELLTITCTKDKEEIVVPNYQGIGSLIPIGGGKDSSVTLELLKEQRKENLCFMINPKDVMINCCTAAGFKEEDIIGVKRLLDRDNLAYLRDKGFLNGHIPFSSVVAFISYLVAYMTGKKYIVLSNEASANEATVIGTKINHQYSKTFEFEQNFYEYTKKSFIIDINYFSLLRPISEFQIAHLFSKYEIYHNVFTSCNLGSKKEKWEWCGNCPKCLFVYIILSPFLYKDKLMEIYGQNLYEREDLLPTFLEILGYSQIKPFDCVGTYGEARYAVSLLINQLEELPYLLKYYKDNYPLELEPDYLTYYNKNHNLPSEFETILKKELDKYV